MKMTIWNDNERMKKKAWNDEEEENLKWAKIINIMKLNINVEKYMKMKWRRNSYQ